MLVNYDSVQQWTTTCGFCNSGNSYMVCHKHDGENESSIMLCLYSILLTRTVRMYDLQFYLCECIFMANLCIIYQFQSLEMGDCYHVTACCYICHVKMLPKYFISDTYSVIAQKVLLCVSLRNMKSKFCRVCFPVSLTTFCFHLFDFFLCRQGCRIHCSDTDTYGGFCYPQFKGDHENHSWQVLHRV